MKDAHIILLRGYAGTINPEETEAFSRMSVSRAIAVRSELASNGIDRSKIRILLPKYQWVDPSDPDSPSNRSVVVTLKMQDGAKKNEPLTARAQTEQPSARANKVAVAASPAIIKTHRQMENSSPEAAKAELPNQSITPKRS